MTRCTLYYPGLLGPAVPLQELQADAWPDRTTMSGLLLALRCGRLSALPAVAFEQRLLSLMGFVCEAGVELPVAQLRQSTPASPVSGSLWCLDPVNIRLDREMAYLADSDLLDLSDSEAQALIESINSHFSGELHVRSVTPHEWLVESELSLITYTPTQARFQDVNTLQAQGKDAGRWRKLITEIQMLLHAHPVNVQRDAQGKLTANSVWLWGGGDMQIRADGMPDSVYADVSLAALAAARNAIAFDALPAQFDAHSVFGKHTLIVATAALSTIQQKDVYRWLACLQEFESHIIVPLLDGLRQGVLSQLIICSDTLQVTVDKSALGRWWRRPQRPDKTFLALRERYGV